MKITLQQPEPVLPPKVVHLELSQHEANMLYTLMGYFATTVSHPRMQETPEMWERQKLWHIIGQDLRLALEKAQARFVYDLNKTNEP